MTDEELAKEIAHCFVSMPKKGSCKTDEKDALLYKIMFEAREELQGKIAAAFKRIRTEENEACIKIANDIPLEEQFIPAGASATSISGLVRVIRKGIVEAIRARSGKKGVSNG